MSDNHNYCVIMAGGWGTRFWPVSRGSKPKQFLSVDPGEKSFLRQTFERMKQVIPEENILVSSLIRYRDLVLEQIPELREENLILEPYNRNTAPCLAYATYFLLKRDPLAVMVATPADHRIKDVSGFVSSMRGALAFAAGRDVLVALGVVPTRPDDNFGYIQTDGMFEDNTPVKIKTFTEKPDKELAAIFMESGEFLWNSGIFVWRASAIKDELEKLSPSITKLWSGWRDFIGTPREGEELQRIYSDVERISIDYAVMEKTDIAWVYPGKFDWADIGNWQALYENIPDRDPDGNALKLDGKSILKENSRSILIQKNKGKLTAVKGLEDYIVYDSEDILFICPRDEESVKDFISDSAMPQFEEYR